MKTGQKNNADPYANGIALRDTMARLRLTQTKALELLNQGQIKPMAMRTFKAYLARPGSASWYACPDVVMARMRQIENGELIRIDLLPDAQMRGLMHAAEKERVSVSVLISRLIDDFLKNTRH